VSDDINGMNIWKGTRSGGYSLELNNFLCMVSLTNTRWSCAQEGRRMDAVIEGRSHDLPQLLIGSILTDLDG
jgi:hypothetical protein